MPDTTDGNLFRMEWVTGTCYFWPMNSEANAMQAAFFATDGALTTVAITQVDAVRGGYGDTTQPYKGLKLALS